MARHRVGNLPDSIFSITNTEPPPSGPEPSPVVEDVLSEELTTFREELQAFRLVREQRSELATLQRTFSDRERELLEEKAALKEESAALREEIATLSSRLKELRESQAAARAQVLREVEGLQTAHAAREVEARAREAALREEVAALKATEKYQSVHALSEELEALRVQLSAAQEEAHQLREQFRAFQYAAARKEEILEQKSALSLKDALGLKQELEASRKALEAAQADAGPARARASRRRLVRGALASALLVAGAALFVTFRQPASGLVFPQEASPARAVARQAHDSALAARLTDAPVYDCGDGACLDLFLEFARNRDSIRRDDQREALRTLGVALKAALDELPPDERARIEIVADGHTAPDAPGGRESEADFLGAWHLSLERASAVLYEFHRAGLSVPSYALSAAGHGDAEPRCAEPGDDCRLRNERITLRIRPRGTAEPGARVTGLLAMVVR